MSDPSLIDRMADLAGIEPRYRDMSGTEVRASADAKRAVLGAMGLATDRDGEARETLDLLEQRAAALIPRVVVANADEGILVPIRTAADVGPVRWQIVAEDGTESEGTAEPQLHGGSPCVALPDLPSGYHRLTFNARGATATATVISAPRSCWRTEGRRWGVTDSVWALDSGRNLGIGDLTDVATIAAATGKRGGDFLGLSPLHALFPADRGRFSPYSPSSRRFIDPIHLDPTAVPGFGPAVARLLADTQGSVAAARGAELVDYRAVWAIKWPILDTVWQLFRRSKRKAEFEAFRRDRGGALERHAIFDALHEHFTASGVPIGKWPVAFRDASSAAVASFAKEHADRVAFFAWLQWVADLQLGAAAKTARDSGMMLGLYCDVAVGPDRDGSDVWSSPDDFGLKLSIGAPPDALAPQGQDWGLPPLLPRALEDNGLQAFRGPIAAAMRHAGAIRIDHAFQLRRLFVAPTGQPATLGAYLGYPTEALMAVLRLESQRARCVVIGEDLGIAPPGFSDLLTASGVLSYRVLYFERHGDGAFKAPAEYPGNALAVINTHDLAPLRGWWRGQDVEDRAMFGITDAGQTEAGRSERVRDRRHLMRRLNREGLGADDVPSEVPIDAVIRLTGRTPSVLVAVALDDLAGAIEAPNIPGVVGASNWRRRTPMSVEKLAEPGGPLDRLAAAMGAEGRGRPRSTGPETPQKEIPAIVRPSPPATRTLSLRQKPEPMKKSTPKPPVSPRKPGNAPLAAGKAPSGESRVVIEAVWPELDGGLSPVKRVAGDTIELWADIFTDGHDKIAAEILYRPMADPVWRRAPMHFLDNDRWSGQFTVTENARHVYTIEAWRDPYASWRAEVEKKKLAGRDVALEIMEGLRIADRAAGRTTDETAALSDLTSRLAALNGNAEGQWSLMTSPKIAALLAATGERSNLSRYPRELELIVDRPAARFSAWYELFPRSASGDPARHGTFDDVIRRLPYVRDLGFDVLYFPPIHPIGVTNRKGKNNSLRASPGEPGSVYAIGNAEGGHDAVHRELGTIADFDRLVAEAAKHGLEIALDFAINCSLDHPWIKQHPEWFEWRPDGTLKFAENPPKKYEDITNVHFYGEAFPSLWYALRDVVLFWVEHGVRIFRVDNPHTKPLPFWQWMIREVNDRDPGVIFLAEAFTRPKMMKKLAKVGFQQSYTYFTWRDSKADLTDYVKELAGDMGEYYRPNFFANTPDINPSYLQTSGRAGFIVRSTLAATLSSTWGIYNGFELCEATPLPGKEEYLDSEKYEVRAWDVDRPGNIKAHIAALNRIRRDNPALHDFRNVQFVNAWNDNVIAYSRATKDKKNVLLVLVNLDPKNAQTTYFEVPLWEFGLTDSAMIQAEDLLLGLRFDLNGKSHKITLDPAQRSVVIWRLTPPA